MIYKTGLLPAPEPPELKFRSYLVPHLLPPIPATFGHYSLIKKWGMLLNDSVGDCTVAGAMHAIMLWNAQTNRNVRFTNLDAEEDYSAITGYNPNHPSSDTGADMVQVAKYWQGTGFRDARAHRHKILAYLQVDHRNLVNIDTAAYLFGAVGLGVQVRESDMLAFEHARPWIVQTDPVVGYHYVPYVGRDKNRKVVTWGGTQDVTEPWLIANCNEVVAMISMDALVNEKSLEGFDLAALQDDLDVIGL